MTYAFDYHEENLKFRLHVVVITTVIITNHRDTKHLYSIFLKKKHLNTMTLLKGTFALSEEQNRIRQTDAVLCIFEFVRHVRRICDHHFG